VPASVEWSLAVDAGGVNPGGPARYNDRVPGVLKLGPEESSEDRELAFELEYQRSLTTAQRFEMMFRRSREMAEELLRRGYRRPSEVVKRT
jgi:hypothetical protein